MAVYVGIDIGGTNTRVGIVGSDMELIDFTIQSSQDVFRDSGGGSLIAPVAAVLEKNGVQSVRGIAIGLPSIISKSGVFAVSTPNIRHLDGVDLITPLRSAFSAPVLLAKDANLLLIYEMYCRNIPPERTVLGIYLGTGIGNAVNVNGRLLAGRNNAACELGHIPIWNNDRQCACGNRGCSETIASGKCLEEIARQHFPDTDIHHLFEKQWPDPILDDFIDRLSYPIATEVNIFDPDYVVLGGGIPQMPGFPGERLTGCIRRKMRPYIEEEAEIIFSQGSQEAGVMGAAIYAMQCERDKEEIC